jgi:hypothetical protein
MTSTFLPKVEPVSRHPDQNTSFGILLRIRKDDPDPRHQVIHRWYQQFPVGPGGRRIGIQNALLDVLHEALADDDADGDLEPSPYRRSRPAAARSQLRSNDDSPPSGSINAAGSGSLSSRDKDRREKAAAMVRNLKF